MLALHNLSLNQVSSYTVYVCLEFLNFGRSTINDSVTKLHSDAQPILHHYILIWRCNLVASLLNQLITISCIALRTEIHCQTVDAAHNVARPALLEVILEETWLADTLCSIYVEYSTFNTLFAWRLGF